MMMCVCYHATTLICADRVEQCVVLRLPRYARINTLKTSVEYTLHVLKMEEYVQRSFKDVCSCSCLVQHQGVSKWKRNSVFVAMQHVASYSVGVAK